MSRMDEVTSDLRARLEPPAPLSRRTQFRWVICALLFFATTINYVDRQVIGILAPTLERELGFGEIDYGNIVFCGNDTSQGNPLTF
jgi:hypothetical protein